MNYLYCNFQEVFYVSWIVIKSYTINIFYPPTISHFEKAVANGLNTGKRELKNPFF